ncbi:RNHCP domain-containing protein [Salinispira pacifica]|uniref:RNHCP domain-containing protein n=1 Tax=Salinispira pacifica TaxID=1307761 RepID=UPI0006A72E8E|nr:RNHCP domain-containing protein [Salinispira pacifica]
MGRKYEQKYQSVSSGFGPFRCTHCGTAVIPPASGSRHRNHCPACLRSLHVDLLPGDRRSRCRDIMHPIALWVKDDGELSILHRCEKCGTVKSNRILPDDSEPLISELAARPALAVGLA